MRSVDEQISLTDGNAFVFIQNPQFLDLREIWGVKKLQIDLGLSGCREEVMKGGQSEKPEEVKRRLPSTDAHSAAGGGQFKRRHASVQLLYT